MTGLREWFVHRRDAWRYLRSPRRSLVLIICTMRSGSTLLKAILGAAPDVSHLPEVPFHQLRTNDFDFYTRFCTLAPEPIVVLKHPLWFTDVILEFTVPRLRRVRVIALVRDCYPTLCSIKAMPGDDTPDDATLVEYWLRSTTAIVHKATSAGARGLVLRYEDLAAQPLEVSAALFRFIGSRKRDGLRQYTPPSTGEWRWGTDDGSANIRSGEVRPPADHDGDAALLARIEADERVARLRARLGYMVAPAADAPAVRPIDPQPRP